MNPLNRKINKGGILNINFMGHKVCTELEDELFLLFKECTSKKGKFTRGYTSRALKRAVQAYVLMDQVHPDFEDLLTIAAAKHPEMDRDELIKSVFDECREMYLKENLK